MSDRHQCWEQTSGHTYDDGYDLIYMDDDLLKVLVSSLNTGESEDIKHRTEMCSFKKPAKGKRECRLPSKGWVSEPDNKTVRQLLDGLIDSGSGMSLMNSRSKSGYGQLRLNRGCAHHWQTLPKPVANVRQQPV